MDEKTVLELREELKKLKKAQARVKRKFTFLLSIIAMLVLVTATYLDGSRALSRYREPRYRRYPVEKGSYQRHDQPISFFRKRYKDR